MTGSRHPAHWLIELLAWWEGSVQPSQLAAYWQCTRQHASKKLNIYRAEHPHALGYNEARKAYFPTDSFTPVHISCEANEYLNWLIGYSPSPQQQLATWTWQPPPRNITPQLMRPLVQALREGLRVDVEYGSMSRAGRNGRIIAPHHLVKTSSRWHLRAWCEEKRQYLDFVLSRFHGIPDLLDKSEQAAKGDSAWNTEVDIVLAADPRLSPEIQHTIQQDYGMKNNRLIVRSRACMVNYTLQGLNLDPGKLEASAEAQQIVIVNLNDIKPWLFG